VPLDVVTAPSRRVTQRLRMLLAAGSLARVVARGRLRIGLESSA